MLAKRNILVNRTNVLLSFQASTFLLPWLIVIWLTHQSDIESVGRFSYLLALISPLCLLLASPSRNFLISAQLQDFDDAHQFRNLFSLCGLILVALLAAWFQQPWLLICVFLFKMAESYFDLKIAKYIRDDDVRQLLYLNMKKWGIILIAALLVLLSGQLLLSLVVTAILFFYVASQGQNTRLFHCAPLNGRALVFLPLSLSALVFSLYFNIPRYFLGSKGSEDLLAVFSISSFLLMGGLVVINSFMQAKIYVLKKVLVEEQPGLVSVLLQTVFLMLIIYLLIQVFQIDIVSQLFWSAHNHLTDGNPAYKRLYKDVLTLSWGPILFSVSNYFLIASGQHKSLLLITSINSVLVFILCQYLFLDYGISGMLWAINISGVLQALMIAFVFRFLAGRK